MLPTLRTLGPRPCLGYPHPSHQGSQDHPPHHPATKGVMPGQGGVCSGTLLQPHMMAKPAQMLCVGVPRGSETKSHTRGDFKHRNVLFHSSGGQKSEIKVSAGLAPSESVRRTCPGLFQLLLVCWQPLMFLASRSITPLCLHIHRVSSLCVSVCVQISQSYKETSHVGLDPH